MEQKAYAKINLILNVLGTRPDGFHEVEMLMQAIDLCDIVRVEYPAVGLQGRFGADLTEPSEYVLGPQDFEYGGSDLAYKAVLLMAERFRPELLADALDSDGLELAAGVKNVRISIEKHIPAAAGLAGGSSDAAAVMVCLAKLWGLAEEIVNSDTETAQNDNLLGLLLPLGAQLGSDVPFCIASQLGRPAAIARGRGTELEFVGPTDCGVELYFSCSPFDLPDKTRAVYSELRAEDCSPRYDIKAFLAANTIEEKRVLMGNHLQAPAERLFGTPAETVFGTSAEDPAEGSTDGSAIFPSMRPILCGAGPTYFTIAETGTYHTITTADG